MSGNVILLESARRRAEVQAELRQVRLAYAIQVGPDAVSLLLGTADDGTEICTSPEGAEELAAELLAAARKAREAEHG